MTCRVVPALTVPLSHRPVPAGQVVAGAPATGLATLAEVSGVEAGVWEHTVGASRDVECDEVFVVVGGRATIDVEGGPALHLSAGDVVVLEAGARTTWTVHETLRKVWFTPPA